MLVGGADAEHCPPVREGVDRDHLLGELEGGAERHARDVCAKPHVLRLSRYPRKVGPGIGLVERGVVDNVERLEAELVDLADLVVQGPSTRGDEAELHGEEVPAEELPGACVASSSRSSTLPNM